MAVKTTSVGAGDSVDFDATQVDAATVRFGHGQAPVVGTPVQTDIDSDLDMDVVYSFDVQASDFTCDDTDATLKGETYANEQFQGTDSIATDCEGSCHSE